MDTSLNVSFPFGALKAILSIDDDPDLWSAALSVVTDDFLQKYRRHSKNRNWGMVVGVCFHWLRPHQTRWTKAGGFAYPNGYKGFRPEFDWSLVVLFRGGEWIPVEGLPLKRLTFFQVV
ncbi:MAG: hypothetical protein ACRD4A_07880, partial [Candidatus Acidiferrales bacterium]